MRVCLFAAAFAVAAAGLPQSQTLSGKLVQRSGQAPALETPDHRLIALDGDADTRAVLADKRLSGFEMEAKGHFEAPDRFLIDPMHTRAMMVRKDGHLKYITYWCEVCSIRSYTPGLCWCCQKETTLDLRDPDAK